MHIFLFLDNTLAGKCGYLRCSVVINHQTDRYISEAIAIRQVVFSGYESAFAKNKSCGRGNSWCNRWPQGKD